MRTLYTLAQDWRDDAENSDMCPEYKEALRQCAAELDARMALENACKVNPN